MAASTNVVKLRRPLKKGKKKEKSLQRRYYDNQVDL